MNPSPAPPSLPPDANFQPSLAAVIGMLSIMFTLTFILLLYAKFCHRPASAVFSSNNQIHDSLVRSRGGGGRTLSGLDRSLLDSLPFFPFSSLNGARHGLDCAVCLTKFHDQDLLRLLPKCKHAFHIDCIDQWLHKHSTCPLCRHRVSADDLVGAVSSLRFLSGRTELYVHREPDEGGTSSSSRHESSRFFGSFRKSTDDVVRDEENGRLPITKNEDADDQTDQKSLHKLNHRIVVSEVVLKQRWSNVTSADLMVLNSEMVNYVSSARFDYPVVATTRKEEEEITEEADVVMDIKKEMERKMLFESRVREIAQFRHPGTRISTSTSTKAEAAVSQNDKRSMSEIIVHPRFMDNNCKDLSSSTTLMVKEERRRRIWLPIARKTVQWFANRETTTTTTTTRPSSATTTLHSTSSNV